MKKNNKKLLYMLALSFMLTACNKESEEIESTEIVNECLETHLDKDTLQIHTLSDGSKYVTDMDVLASVREQFLKNNQIFNTKGINAQNEYFEQLMNDTEYMYMYENSELRKLMVWIMEKLQEKYPGHNPAEILLGDQFYRDYNTFDEISMYLPIKNDKEDYSFIYAATPSLAERITVNYETNGTKYTKYMTSKNASDRYDIYQNYSFETIDKSGLNKITISLSQDYNIKNELVQEGIFTCEDYDATLVLNNELEDEIIYIQITEEQFNQLATLLTDAIKEGKNVEQFLEENDYLLIEIYGDEYKRFIEIAKIYSYVKKPV